MSFDFHHNKQEYFLQQYKNSANAVIPFIKRTRNLKPGIKVLEIGCAEGGVLKAFTDIGCVATGIELSQSKLANAHRFMASEVQSGKVTFICKNVYDSDFQHSHAGYFDVIILKDTIEHIHDQQKLMKMLHEMLADEGLIFVGFPPWYMPWGGHQQICTHKILMYTPWIHLLPVFLYKKILKVFGQSDVLIEMLLEIKQTGISSYRFEKICKISGFTITDRLFYFINPIYEYKFGLAPRTQHSWLGHFPYLRDFLCTTVYYTLTKSTQPS